MKRYVHVGEEIVEAYKYAENNFSNLEELKALRKKHKEKL